MQLQQRHQLYISIHAPREGCDGPRYRSHGGALRFQSTHPARGATGRFRTGALFPRYFNPRTPRGVRRIGYGGVYIPCDISIHAPREGCDCAERCGYALWHLHFNPRTPRGVRRFDHMIVNILGTISIHAPREGCDFAFAGWGHALGEFQSTHPARGATLWEANWKSKRKISIHAPREGCDKRKGTKIIEIKISIHAPREGCDHLTMFLRPNL